jgi:transcriptional regulator with XRE-family HTH domain
MLQIHKRIKDERIKAGLSEDEIAEKIGVGRTTYQYWEKKTPAVDKIKKVAKALGLPEDYFFINAEKQIPGPATPVANENPPEFNMVLPLGDLKITLKDYVDLLNEYKNKAEDAARKAEERERELLGILKENILTIKANSEKTLIGLQGIRNMTRADDLSMMEGTDKILGREPGATALEAGIVELSLRDPDQDIHTNVANDTKGKPGKGMQQQS